MNAELEQLRRDAERYRWLRDKGFKHANVDLGTDCDGDHFVEFKSTFRVPDLPALAYENEDWNAPTIDAAIDAAIKGAK